MPFLKLVPATILKLVPALPPITAAAVFPWAILLPIAGGLVFGLTQCDAGMTSAALNPQPVQPINPPDFRPETSLPPSLLPQPPAQAPAKEVPEKGLGEGIILVALIGVGVRFFSKK
jgi:hypothetical protein